MGPLIRGAMAQLATLFRLRRFQVMFALLLGLSLLSVELYRPNVLRSMPVALVDMDNSRLSRRIRVHLSSMREVDVVAEFVGSPADAQRLMTEGRVSALVIIPSAFSSDIKRGAKGQVLVGVDMSNILVGKNIHKAIIKSVGTVGAGVQLTTVQKLGARADEAMATVVPLVIEENYSFNPATNYSVYITPSLLLFLLHLYTIVVAASVWLPDRASEGLRSKIGALLAIFAVCFAVGVALLYVFLPWAGISPASGPAAMFTLLACLLVSDILLATALFAFLPNPLSAMEATVAIAALSLMLSGVTWPTDMFPPALQTFSSWLPFTPFAKGLRTLVHYPTALSDARLWLTGLARECALYGLVILIGGATRLLISLIRRRRIAW